MDIGGDVSGWQCVGKASEGKGREGRHRRTELRLGQLCCRLRGTVPGHIV